MDYQLAAIEYYKSWIKIWNRDFSLKKWTNPARARSLINQGMEIMKDGKASVDELRPIALELSSMLPRSEKPQNVGLLRQSK